MSHTALSLPHGQNQEIATEEINFPKKEYQDWLQIQQNPNLDDYEKIKSTITTYFQVVFESWSEKKWLDFGFLFDQTDPEAMADYAYEKGFHQVWIARWRDYGIQLNRYDFQPRFLRYSKDNNQAKTQATPDAKLIFRDTPDRFENSSLGYLYFSLVKQNEKWLLNGVRSDSPKHNVFPKGSNFDKLVEEIPSSIEIIETESELMQSLKKHRSPRNQQRLKIMQKQLEKPHIMTLKDIKRNFKFHRIEHILLLDGRYALVKKERPKEPSWFSFFDLVTGEKQILSTGSYFAQLHKIKSPNWYIFYADGTISEYYAKDFPVLIECSRMEEGEKFRREFKARYLPIHEGAEFGSKSNTVIEDIKVSIQGIEISIGPMKGHEDKFYAAFTDIPVTKTSYKKEKHQFIIHFMKTRISENITADNRHIEVQNRYIKSANLVSDESSCKLIVNLKESANFYRGFRKWLDSGTPYALFTFHSEEERLQE